MRIMTRASCLWCQKKKTEKKIEKTSADESNTYTTHASSSRSFNILYYYSARYYYHRISARISVRACAHHIVNVTVYIYIPTTTIVYILLYYGVLQTAEPTAMRTDQLMHIRSPLIIFYAIIIIECVVRVECACACFISLSGPILRICSISTNAIYTVFNPNNHTMLLN